MPRRKNATPPAVEEMLHGDTDGVLTEDDLSEDDLDSLEALGSGTPEPPDGAEEALEISPETSTPSAPPPERLPEEPAPAVSEARKAREKAGEANVKAAEATTAAARAELEALRDQQRQRKANPSKARDLLAPFARAGAGDVIIIHRTRLPPGRWPQRMRGWVGIVEEWRGGPLDISTLIERHGGGTFTLRQFDATKRLVNEVPDIVISGTPKPPPYIDDEDEREEGDMLSPYQEPPLPSADPALTAPPGWSRWWIPPRVPGQPGEAIMTPGLYPPAPGAMRLADGQAVPVAPMMSPPSDTEAVLERLLTKLEPVLKPQAGAFDRFFELQLHAQEQKMKALELEAKQRDMEAQRERDRWEQERKDRIEREEQERKDRIERERREAETKERRDKEEREHAIALAKEARGEAEARAKLEAERQEKFFSTMLTVLQKDKTPTASDPFKAVESILRIADTLSSKAPAIGESTGLAIAQSALSTLERVAPYAKDILTAPREVIHRVVPAPPAAVQPGAEAKALPAAAGAAPTPAQQGGQQVREQEISKVAAGEVLSAFVRATQAGTPPEMFAGEITERPEWLSVARRFAGYPLGPIMGELARQKTGDLAEIAPAIDAFLAAMTTDEAKAFYRRVMGIVGAM